MKATLLEYGAEFDLSLEPETVQEASMLSRYILKSDTKKTSFDISYRQNTLFLRVVTPIAKRREHYSNIKSENLEIY